VNINTSNTITISILTYWVYIYWLDANRMRKEALIEIRVGGVGALTNINIFLSLLYSNSAGHSPLPRSEIEISSILEHFYNP